MILTWYFKKYIEVAPMSLAIWRAFEAQKFSEISDQLEGPILDIGCGFGEFAGVAFNSLIEVGIDINQKDLVLASKKNKYKNLILVDARKLPFEDESFKTVVSISTLEHIEQVDKVFREVNRVLKKGGRFVFTVPTEEINKAFIGWRLLKMMGLDKIANIYIWGFHRTFSHKNIISEKKWIAKLQKVGLDLELCEGTISSGQVRLFELFLPIALPTVINRRLFGRRIVYSWRGREMIFELIMKLIGRGSANSNEKLNIIVMAKKN